MYGNSLHFQANVYNILCTLDKEDIYYEKF